MVLTGEILKEGTGAGLDGLNTVHCVSFAQDTTNERNQSVGLATSWPLCLEARQNVSFSSRKGKSEYVSLLQWGVIKSG
jgi:hypothetical protein